MARSYIIAIDFSVVDCPNVTHFLNFIRYSFYDFINKTLNGLRVMHAPFDAQSCQSLNQQLTTGNFSINFKIWEVGEFKYVIVLHHLWIIMKHYRALQVLW